MTRLPFKSSVNRSNHPLELIHFDVCGLITPIEWNILSRFENYDMTCLALNILCDEKVTYEEAVNYEEKDKRHDTQGSPCLV